MITLAIELRGIRTTADRGWLLTIALGELTPQQIYDLDELLHEVCYMALKKDAFSKDELAILEHLNSEIDSTRHKTPGQRLRGVLYRLWEQDKQGYEDFTLYYGFRMEKIIEHFKSKLE